METLEAAGLGVGPFVSPESAHASPPPCSFVSMEWEVAEYRAEGAWQVLGRIDGSNPEVALSAWIDEEGGVEGGSYGVRSSGADAWQSFHVVNGVRAVDDPG